LKLFLFCSLINDCVLLGKVLELALRKLDEKQSQAANVASPCGVAW
jgi:hypothetical protein